MARKAPVIDDEWLIPSKVTLPLCTDEVIDRPRLRGEILGDKPRRITLLLAPPGYGKTTLVAQWSDRLRQADHSVAWLSLDEDDDDPATFLSYLAASLERAGVALPSVAAELRQAPRGLRARASLAMLIRAIDRHPGKVMLVLEDAHHLRDARVLAVMDTLLERLPAHAHLCMTARTRTSLRLAAAFAQGHLTLLEAGDLRFTLDEAVSYFGPGYSRDVIARFQEGCEGWPIALQLVKVHVGRGAAVTGDYRFGGPGGDLAAYLTEQVLATLPDLHRDALLRTCILDRMSAELIDRLTDRSDGAEILETLRAANLFVAPIDADGRWFRYHPLFASFLRERAERIDMAVVKQSHRAAALWFRDQGFIRDALRHARQAGDSDLFISILESVGGWRAVLRGGPGVLKAFHDLPPEIVARSPRLRLGQIYLMVHESRVAEGRRAFANLIAAAGGPDSAQLKEVRNDLLIIDLLLRAHAAEPMTVEAMREIERAIQAADGDDPVTEPIIQEMTSLAQYWAGEFDRAYDRALSASRASQRRQVPFIQFYSEMFAGLCLFERGEFEKGLGLFGRTVALADGLWDPQDDRVLTPKVFMAEVALDRGEAAAAAEMVAPFLDVIEEGECWFDLLRPAFAVAVATAEQSEIWFHLRRAERLSERPELRRLAGFIAAAALRRAAAEGDLARSQALFEFGPFREALAEPVQDWRGETEILLAAADYAILSGDAASAGAYIARVEPGVTARKQARVAVRVAMQRAALHWKQGGAKAAIAAFSSAVGTAAPIGLLRPFHDHAAAAAALAERLLRSGERLPAEANAFLVGLCEQRGAEPQDRQDNLSPREREILRLISGGQTSKEVARQLGVSVNTVMTHRKSIYRKLEAVTRSQVITTARVRGIIA